MFRPTWNNLQAFIQKNFKALLIIYLILLHQILKLFSIKPKRVAKFS
jgi:hypothetical protein